MCRLFFPEWRHGTISSWFVSVIYISSEMISGLFPILDERTSPLERPAWCLDVRPGRKLIPFPSKTAAHLKPVSTPLRPAGVFKFAVPGSLLQPAEPVPGY
jgi:hypothetical protein